MDLIRVNSLEEAKGFFLGNCKDNCICIDGNRELEVNCYPDAEKFYSEIHPLIDAFIKFVEKYPQHYTDIQYISVLQNCEDEDIRYIIEKLDNIEKKLHLINLRDKEIIWAVKNRLRELLSIDYYERKGILSTGEKYLKYQQK